MNEAQNFFDHETQDPDRILWQTKGRVMIGDVASIIYSVYKAKNEEIPGGNQQVWELARMLQEEGEEIDKFGWLDLEEAKRILTKYEIIEEEYSIEQAGEGVEVSPGIIPPENPGFSDN